jgi:Kef-type K+ transport system membrane component KefB
MHATMNTSEIFLIAMLIIFAIPYLVWRLLKTEYYAPLVVVQIIGGIILGPGVLGHLFPDYYGFVFSKPVIAALNGIAWWAVMIFVWVAGIELDLKQAWTLRKETGSPRASPYWSPAVRQRRRRRHVALRRLGRPKGAHWQFLLGTGMACAVTALPVLVLLMEKLDILRQPMGQRILRYASLDDVAIWGVLALIMLDWERMGRQLGFLLGFTILTFLFRRLMARLKQDDRWYMALIWLIACAFGADWAGLHFMVGAFLAGVVMDAGWFDQDKLDSLFKTVLLVLMPVFFLSTGLRTKWDLGGYSVFFAGGLLLIASVGGKLVGAHLAGRLLKWKEGEASIIGART